MGIELKLEAIYRAAHVDIPAQALLVSDQGSLVADATSSVAAEIARTGHGIGRDVFDLGDEVVFRLRQVTRTMNNCAIALDRIADDFVATDDEAAEWVRRHSSWLEKNGYDGAPEKSAPPEQPEAR